MRRSAPPSLWVLVLLVACAGRRVPEAPPPTPSPLQERVVVDLERQAISRMVVKPDGLMASMYVGFEAVNHLEQRQLDTGEWAVVAVMDGDYALTLDQSADLAASRARGEELAQVIGCAFVPHEAP